MSFSSGRGFGNPPPKKELGIEEAKAAILVVCHDGASYQGIDALLHAVNDADKTQNLARQTARVALSQLREDGKISPSDADIRIIG